MSEQSVDDIHRRLKKVIGQLNGIDKIIQLNAAKSAIHKIGQIVLQGHINHCVRNRIQDEKCEIDTTLSELASAIEHFSRMS